MTWFFFPIKSTDTSRGILADNQRLPIQPVVTGSENRFRRLFFGVPWVIIKIEIKNEKRCVIVQ